jgi:hypothetical protein
MKTENSLFGFISMFFITITFALIGVTQKSAPFIALLIGGFGISAFAIIRRKKMIIDVDFGVFAGSIAFAIGEVIYYFFFFHY